jgi:hypothetical protein
LVPEGTEVLAREPRGVEVHVRHGREVTLHNVLVEDVWVVAVLDDFRAVLQVGIENWSNLYCVTGRMQMRRRGLLQLNRRPQSLILIALVSVLESELKMWCVFRLSRMNA